jgi:hypothetical protein
MDPGIENELLFFFTNPVTTGFIDRGTEGQ